MFPRVCVLSTCICATCYLIARCTCLCCMHLCFHLFFHMYLCFHMFPHRSVVPNVPVLSTCICLFLMHLCFHIYLCDPHVSVFPTCICGFPHVCRVTCICGVHWLVSWFLLNLSGAPSFLCLFFWEGAVFWEAYGRDFWGPNRAAQVP